MALAGGATVEWIRRYKGERGGECEGAAAFHQTHVRAVRLSQRVMPTLWGVMDASGSGIT